MNFFNRNSESIPHKDNARAVTLRPSLPIGAILVVGLLAGAMVLTYNWWHMPRLQALSSAPINAEHPYYYGIDDDDPSEKGEVITWWTDYTGEHGKKHDLVLYSGSYAPATQEEVDAQWELAIVFCNAAYEHGVFKEIVHFYADENGNYICPCLMPPVSGTVDVGF